MNSSFKLALAGCVLFCLSLLLAGVGVPEFSHRVHPLALRGAIGLPGAMLFNAGAFVLPGVCLLLASHGFRVEGWGERIGLRLLQLSALAFALQGAVQIDQRGVEMLSSRLHVTLWMLWWIAFVPAMVLLAFVWRRQRWVAAVCAATGLLLPLLTVLLPIGAWVGGAQRLAFLLWLSWWLWAAKRFGRR